MVDCHWQQHGKEVQSLWRKKDKNAYQCDHAFTDRLTAMGVLECNVIDNADVRRLSDHGPLELMIDERLLATEVQSV